MAISLVHSRPSVNRRVSGALPNLIIIGAMKSATTSLFNYLKAHPKIGMSPRKELHFFNAGGWKGNWQLGLDWYRTNFDPAAQIRGEATPNYTQHDVFPGTAERIAATVPHAKLIYLVRDPIQRIVSHYLHRVARGEITSDFSTAIRTYENGLISPSWYGRELEIYRQHFPAEQIQVLEFSELIREPRQTMDAACAFLGVDAAEIPASVYSRIHNKTQYVQPRWPSLVVKARRAGFARYLRYIPRPIHRILYRKFAKPEVSDADRRFLTERLQDDAALLRQLTGMPLAHWAV